MSAEIPYYREPRFRRLWVVGLLASFTRWLDILAFGVFTYQQTHSAFWVASMTMLRMLPLALFGLAYGAAATRISRRTCLLVTHSLLAATSLGLLVITLLGALSVWHLAVASFISGSVWAGDMPMRRGFIGDVVGPARMGQSMAADALANNGSRLFGPAVGGLLLAVGGMPGVLGAGVVLYLVVLSALAGLPRQEDIAPSGLRMAAPWTQLLEGVRVARKTPRLSGTLCNTILFNLFCWPALSMVPVVGQERLKLGTQGVGLLASMDGLGALIGAVLLMSLARHARHGQVYMGGTFLFLLMLPVFALSTYPVLSGVALIGLGLGQGMFAVMQATLVYLAVAHEQRHKAMGLMTVCIGTSPLGFLQVGWLAEHLGATGACLITTAAGVVSLALTWKVWRAVWRDAPVTYTEAAPGPPV